MPTTSVNIDGTFTHTDPVTGVTQQIDLSKDDKLEGEIVCKKRNKCKLATAKMSLTSQI